MTFPRFDPADVIEAAGRHVDTALEAVPQALLESGIEKTLLDLYVLVDPEAAWQLAHLSLDAFGAHLSDQFGYYSLSAPMEYEGRILLRLRTAAPREAVDALIPAFEAAAERTIREVLGPEAQLAVDVHPAEEGA
jgi:hypothetical protein